MSSFTLSDRYGMLIDAAGVDITPEQWALIDQLYQTNGISQNDLANGTFKNAPTVSRIIDLLCKKGWTKRTRREDDRRSFNIFLTKEGEEIVKILLPKVAHLRKIGQQDISEKDYETFVGIMNKIYENYQDEIIG